LTDELEDEWSTIEDFQRELQQNILKIRQIYSRKISELVKRLSDHQIDKPDSQTRFLSSRVSPNNPLMLLDGEWRSEVWEKSLITMQQNSRNTEQSVQVKDDGSLLLEGAFLELETSQYFDDSPDQDSEIAGVTFHFERIKLSKGVFQIAISFRTANATDPVLEWNSTQLSLLCLPDKKTCEVSRKHTAYSHFKTRNVKIFNFSDTTPSPGPPLEFSLTVRKIGCGFFFLVRRPGESSPFDLFMINNLEFCSNDWKLKLSSPAQVSGEVSSVRISRFHGTCSIATVCQCHPGWKGNECNVRGDSKYDDTAEKQFKEMISKLQNPRDCSQTRAFVFSWNDWAWGLGNSMHWMLAAFTWSIKRNRTFIMAENDTWIYVDKEACPSCSYNCYFLPLSNCSVASLNSEKIPLSQSTLNERVVHGYIPRPTRPEFKENPLTMHNSLANRSAEMDIVPTPFKHKGLIWWYSQLFSYVWKPNPQVSKIIENFKKKLKLPPVYYALHVRRGDKIAENPNSPPDWYVKTIEEFNKQRLKAPPIQNLFLATDDPGIMGEFVDKFPQYNWYYDATEKRLNGTTMALIQRND